MPSRCICPATRCSRGRCTFSFRGSVACLVCAAKPYRSRSTSSSTRRTWCPRDQTRWSPSSTSSSRSTVWARATPVYTVTTALARIRIASCCGTVLGESWLVSTDRSHCTSSWLATRSLPPTGASVYWSRPSVALLYPALLTWRQWLMAVQQ